MFFYYLPGHVNERGNTKKWGERQPLDRGKERQKRKRKPGFATVMDSPKMTSTTKPSDGMKQETGVCCNKLFQKETN